MAVVRTVKHHGAAERIGAYYVAGCSCGWLSPPRPTHLRCRLDFVAHLEALGLAAETMRVVRAPLGRG